MNLYDDDVCNSQFLIGSNILAAPILYPKTNNRHVYLPKSRWYDLHTGKMYEKGNYTLSNVTLTAKVPLFLSEGSVIFMQNTTAVISTKQLNNVF
jgi:alpha-glucosidase (family GH31 glycosyl hydrolase)